MLSVVIPSYNRKDSVLTLLGDLSRQEGVKFELIVVDDRSSDETVCAVTREFPSVRLIRSKVNGGPAVARNRGIKIARGEYVIGFDSDVRVRDRTLLRRVMETFDQEPETTALAFRVIKSDGASDDAKRWFHPAPISTHATREFTTDYFSGTGYALRRTAAIEAGLFTEIFYIHYEELELALRILDAGGTIRYCPDLLVEHHEHRVSNRSQVDLFFRPRNQILLVLGCYPVMRGVFYLGPRVVYQFGRAVIHGHLSSFLRAIRSAGELAPLRLAGRRPLKRKTWRRIAALRVVERQPLKTRTSRRIATLFHG